MMDWIDALPPIHLLVYWLIASLVFGIVWAIFFWDRHGTKREPTTVEFLLRLDVRSARYLNAMLYQIPLMGGSTSAVVELSDTLDAVVGPPTNDELALAEEWLASARALAQ